MSDIHKSSISAINHLFEGYRGTSRILQYTRYEPSVNDDNASWTTPVIQMLLHPKCPVDVIILLLKYDAPVIRGLILIGIRLPDLIRKFGPPRLSSDYCYFMQS